MKKGFTLIELIGVILIISLMALIIIPNVSKYMKEGTEKADCDAYESIVMAGRNCISDGNCTFNNGISLIDKPILINNKYLEEPLKIPSTNKPINIIELSISRNKNDISGKYTYKNNYLHINGNNENVLNKCS